MDRQWFGCSGAGAWAVKALGAKDMPTLRRAVRCVVDRVDPGHSLAHQAHGNCGFLRHIGRLLHLRHLCAVLVEELHRVLTHGWCSHSPYSCLLYTSDAADEEDSVDLGGRRIIKKKKKKKK
eukprot:TRINITY_DN4481_c0_g1_i6.p3 TRINITY_DN4481_c0_g1~~TRINITY_DN4481_c0_g1_i6.p3  ORF type:complete len:122 (-),score=25.67 TRINITY_DN4481_c0_g1_i6:48-413(-)